MGAQTVSEPQVELRFKPTQHFTHQPLTELALEMMRHGNFQFIAKQHPIWSQCAAKPVPWAWTPITVQTSEAQARARSLTITKNILWIGLNATGAKTFLESGFIQPKGYANLTPAEAIRDTHDDDCFLHASADRSRMVRYAFGRNGQGGGLVLALD